MRHRLLSNIRGDCVEGNAFYVAIAHAERQDAVRIFFVLGFVELHLQRSYRLVLSTGPRFSAVALRHAGDNEARALAVDVLQPEVGVVSRDVIFEPVVIEHSPPPEKLFDRFGD